MYSMMMNYLVKNKIQLGKFSFVGFLTFFINLSLFHIFYGVLTIDYKVAVSIAYVMTVCTHYFLNKTFTFRGADKGVVLSTFKYLSMLMFNYLITLTVVWLLVNVIHGTPYMGLVLSTALTAGVSFLLMRHFVFV